MICPHIVPHDYLTRNKVPLETLSTRNSSGIWIALHKVPPTKTSIPIKQDYLTTMEETTEMIDLTLETSTMEELSTTDSESTDSSSTDSYDDNPRVFPDLSFHPCNDNLTVETFSMVYYAKKNQISNYDDDDEYRTLISLKITTVHNRTTIVTEIDDCDFSGNSTTINDWIKCSIDITKLNLEGKVTAVRFSIF